MDPHLILVIVIVTALAFDFTNGFHDTANVVATSISTGAAVIMAASHFGFPLSITHVINGGIMGSGIAKRLSAVHWGVAVGALSTLLTIFLINVGIYLMVAG